MDYNGPLLGQTAKEKNDKKLKDAVKLLTKDNSIIGIISKKQGVEKRRLDWQKSLSKQIDEILEIVGEELLKTKG